MPSLSNTQMPVRALLRVLPLVSARNLPRDSRCSSLARSFYPEARETARENRFRVRSFRRRSFLSPGDQCTRSLESRRYPSAGLSKNCSIFFLASVSHARVKCPVRCPCCHDVVVILEFTRGARAYASYPCPNVTGSRSKVRVHGNRSYLFLSLFLYFLLLDQIF